MVELSYIFTLNILTIARLERVQFFIVFRASFRWKYNNYAVKKQKREPENK